MKERELKGGRAQKTIFLLLRYNFKKKPSKIEKQTERKRWSALRVLNSEYLLDLFNLLEMRRSNFAEQAYFWMFYQLWKHTISKNCISSKRKLSVIRGKSLHRNRKIKLTLTVDLIVMPSMAMNENFQGLVFHKCYSTWMYNGSDHVLVNRK